MQFHSSRRLARYSAISATFIAVIFVLPSVLGTATFAAGTFSTAVNLSNDANNAQYPMVANSGQYVYVAWTEESHGIFIRVSSNGGATWAPAIKLSPKGGTASYPVITANGSYVYVAWSQTVSKVGQIFFAASSNYGATFSPAIDVDTNTSQTSITPVLAGYGSDISVAWTNNGPSYVRSSTDNGVTWGPAFNIGSFHEPQLAAWGSNMYFVSDGHGGISYGVSHDGGTTWTQSTINASGAEEWVAAAGSYVYIMWEQKHTNGTAPIYGVISSDDGNTFGAVTIYSGSVINDWEPQVSASGNNVYLAFRSLSPQSAWVTMSSNNGATWTTPTELSSNGQAAGWPLDVAISGSYAYTIWGAPKTGSVWNAYASYTSNNGATWTPAGGIDLSNNAVGSAAPATDVASASIMANGTNAYTAWQSTQTGNEQIWFAYS
jgi:hypothetical protein